MQASILTAIEKMPAKARQTDICRLLSEELMESEETEHLLDWLRDAWATLDLLVECWGRRTARAVLLAPGEVSS